MKSIYLILSLLIVLSSAVTLFKNKKKFSSLNDDIERFNKLMDKVEIINSNIKLLKAENTTLNEKVKNLEENINNLSDYYDHSILKDKDSYRSGNNKNLISPPPKLKLQISGISSSTESKSK